MSIAHPGYHTTDYEETFEDHRPRWLQIADDETRRISKAVPGAEYPLYADLQDVYGASRTTIAKAVAELLRRRKIRKASAFRNDGHVIAGGAEQPHIDRLTALARTGRGQLHPEPGENGTCPVCGSLRRGDVHPVWGYSCTACIRSGAVITGYTTDSQE
ncbi:hypothetical protein [Streptomyces sp. NPDC048340]|uniref:hypothetical protein n=1 Tax=Streptomyces sp. NPDC048340 TaxID=3365537 RepID=UPI003720F481